MNAARGVATSCQRAQFGTMISKQAVLALLKADLKYLEESANFTAEEIDFELACVGGKHKIVAKMLKDCPFLSSNKFYIQAQIEYVSAERKSVGRKKVLALLNELV